MYRRSGFFLSIRCLMIEDNNISSSRTYNGITDYYKLRFIGIVHKYTKNAPFFLWILLKSGYKYDKI